MAKITVPIKIEGARFIKRLVSSVLASEFDPGVSEEYRRGHNEFGNALIEFLETKLKHDNDDIEDPLWCEDCAHFCNADMGGEGECDLDGHDTWYGCPACRKFKPKEVNNA